MENGSYDIGWYLIPENVRELFYKPYLKKIETIEARLLDLNLKYHRGFSGFKSGNIKNIFKTGLKKVFGYNIMNLL
jgi:hypothetical protein